MTALAATVCDVPIAAVTVVDADAQWFTALHGAGCSWAQGWLFSAAVPGVALPDVLARLATDAVALPGCRPVAG